MKKLPAPSGLNEREREDFYNDCGMCDSYGDTLSVIKVFDEQLKKLNLEVLLYNDGSSDYVFKIIPREKE